MSSQQKYPRWPLFLIALPAAVAVWSGWVGLGGMCGFGVVHPLPGIWDAATLNTAITLPVGVEAYGAYALGAWLTPGTSARARKFARRSAIGSLALGMLGQVAYHLLAAVHATAAPWPVTMLVSCLPVVALALGTALAHLLHDPAVDDLPSAEETELDSATAVPIPVAPEGEAVADDADTEEDKESSSEEDNETDTVPAKRTVPRRTRGGQTTADKVAALRARHPDMTQAQMAARLKVSERTVRRHLATAA